MSYRAGLDISVGELRFLQLASKMYSEVKIKKCASEQFSTEAIVEGKILQPSIVLAALKQLAYQLNIKKCKATIALPYQCIVTKQIKLPSYLHENEYEAEIIEHLSHYSSSRQNELCFDYIELDQEHDNFRELLLFVAPRSLLDQYVNLVQEAGFVVSGVDINSYALMRAVKKCLNMSGIFSVLHFENKAQLTLVDDNEVVFSQILANSGQEKNLIQEIESLYKMHSISVEENSKIILISETQGECEELQKEIPAKFVKFEDKNKYPDISPKFLTCLGLALRG